MLNIPDEHIHRASTAELVSDRLMNLITSGKLTPGEPLRETQLAKQLGLSRNSLREGIRLLERSRLVRYEIFRGAIVNDPSLDDLEDVYRTRRHIETAALRSKPTSEALVKLRKAWLQLENTTTNSNANSIIAADLTLHKAIVGLIGSERISTFYGSVSDELVFYFSLLSHTDKEYRNPQETIVERHRGIIEAILERRVDEAEYLLVKHITENERRLINILRTRTSTTT